MASARRDFCATATLGARVALLGCALAVLGGCMESAPTRTRSNAGRVNLAGFPPEFQQGYAEGCDGAQRGGKPDAQRYRHDAPYAQGWRDGYSACGGKAR
ncbi:MAG TPA: hypothetical protein VMK05_13400 [Burkholderiales bacterium]|nr:hypothetical protein [Burkholderiales bacterium]